MPQTPKVIMYNAVSLDGFIAGEGDYMGWSHDSDQWRAKCQEAGCHIIGRRTFEMGPPMEGVLNLVMSREPGVTQKSDRVIYFNGGEPHKALEIAAEKGFQTVILSGGAKTDAVFAEAGLVDEVLLGIHSVFLRRGVPIMADMAQRWQLELLEVTPFSPHFIRAHYQVIK
jgi:dihydrofolate reductase